MCGYFIHCHVAILLHDGFNCCGGLWCHHSVAWPGRSESVTELMPFMNSLVHSYTWCSDSHASPYWTFIHRWISMGFTPSLRCSSSVHVASGAAVFTLDLDWLATGRTRKHLGLYCIRTFVRHLCLFSSVIYRGTRTAMSVRPPRGRAPIRSGQSVRPSRGRAPNRSGWSVRPSRGRASNRSGKTEPSISKEGKLRARNGRLNFVLLIRLPRNRKRFLTCRKSTTRDPQLYFPSKGRHA
jgi:hypothetical protein